MTISDLFMAKIFDIKNSTAEFLIFQIKGTVSEVTTESERIVNRSLKFYNLDAIISVGCLNYN